MRGQSALNVSRTLRSVINTPILRLVNWRNERANIADRDRINAGKGLIQQHENLDGSRGRAHPSVAPFGPPTVKALELSGNRAMLNSSSKSIESSFALFPIGFNQFKN